MAKRTYRFLDKDRFHLVVPRIKDALDNAIKETGKTQGQIAEEIGVNKNTLTNWRKGRSVPREDEFERFLNFTGQLDPPITADYFNVALISDPYGEDPDYVAAMGKGAQQYAIDLGLDLNFLRFIIKSAGFEEAYEQWGPIVMEGNEVPSDPGKLKVHRRVTTRESNVAKYAGDFRLGNRVLNKFDLDVFKEMQDFILRVLSLCFIERRIEMEKEISTADEMRKEKYLKAKERKAAPLIKDEDKILTVGELASIDKYYKELTKELPKDILITEVPWEDVGVFKV